MKTEQFIERAKQKHGQKFDYSETIFNSWKEKLKIKCPIHGEFYQYPYSHLHYDCKKCGALECGKKQAFTTDEFIKIAKNIHGKKFDYSKVIYKQSGQRVIITCLIHGDFECFPLNHIGNKKAGCPKCFIEKHEKHYSSKFLKEKSNEIHKNKYTYNFLKDTYRRTEKFEIICKSCGSFFQTMNRHITSQCGCPTCPRRNTEDFIKLSKEIHGNLYNYEKVKYIGNHKKIIITCLEHGEFEQTPATHLRGYGCSSCSSSLGETKIRKFLKENDIKYIAQKKFDDLKLKQHLRFDFYLPDYKTCIEYNGLQHYKQTNFFKESLEKIQLKDNLKYQYCKTKNLHFFIIKYDEEVEVKMRELITLFQPEILA